MSLRTAYPLGIPLEVIQEVITAGLDELVGGTGYLVHRICERHLGHRLQCLCEHAEAPRIELLARGED